MKSSILIFLLLILFSCNKVVEVKGVEAKIFNHWISGTNVEILSPEYFNSGDVVISPPMVWRPLVEVDLVANEGKEKLKQCLFYRVPYKESRGVLKVVSIKSNESCSYLMDVKNEVSFASLDSVDSLKVYFSKTPIRVDGSAKFMDSLTLILKFEAYGKGHEWKFPFYNLKFYDSKKPFELYSSAVKRSLLDGVSVWPSISIDQEFKRSDSKLIGSLKDSYPDKSLVACHKVDRNCRSVTENSCDRCRYGFFEVAGSSCKSGGTKFCGPNRCGEKGWPACRRGLDFNKYPVESGCYPDSPAGFCREGLRVICDSNKILICD